MVQRSHQMIHPQCTLKFIDGYFKKDGWLHYPVKKMNVSDLLKLIWPGLYFLLLWLLYLFNVLLKSLKFHRNTSRDRSYVVFFFSLYFGTHIFLSTFIKFNLNDNSLTSSFPVLCQPFIHVPQDSCNSQTDRLSMS